MGKYAKKRPGIPKKWILAITAAVTAAALAVTALLVLPGTRKPVKVFAFRQIGMTEFWGDNQESYGPVSTDKIQTVFLSDTQTVTEVLVEQGDQVKKGDLLLSYDTTLTALKLERKRLEVEREKLQLLQDKARLEELRNMIPYYGSGTGWVPETPGRKLNPQYPEDDPVYELCFDQLLTYDGTSEDKAVICWFENGKFFQTNELLEWIRGKLQPIRFPGEVPPATEKPTEPTQETTEPTEETTEPPEETTEAAEETTEAAEETTDPDRSAPSGIPGTPTETEPEDSQTKPEVTYYYVVFKVTADNYAKGEKVLWQGMKVTKESAGFSISYFTPAIEDYTETEEEPYIPPYEDTSSGYTQAQLTQMKNLQIKKIAEQDFRVRMAEAEYRIMEAEFNDGSVYAEIDGTVVSLLTEEEAKQTQQPIIKVSSGGGFLIEGSVSELMKETVAVGQEVTVNDWNTGGSYTGTIEYIGDFPIQGDGWTGMGNPNASYYPFRVFVGEEADLRAGTYASIQYAAAGSTQGIYLENPFIRTEGARSYVMVRGTNGRLEKRYITVGKSLWGAYTEVLSGVTEEDFLAFPYAKEAKAGAPTEEGDLSELYNY